jgi:hypothetical protein
MGDEEEAMKGMRWLSVVVLAGVLALAGCGGDDDEEATPTAPADTAVLAADEPLDQASWDEYAAARDSAQAVNEEATKAFRRCRDLLATDADAAKVDECLGTAVTDVVDEGRSFLAVLEGIGEEAGGACKPATTNLHGTVKLYVSTVNAIGLDLERSSLPTNQDVDNAVRTLTAARAAGTAFEEECKPA